MITLLEIFDEVKLEKELKSLGLKLFIHSGRGDGRKEYTIRFSGWKNKTDVGFDLDLTNVHYSYLEGSKDKEWTVSISRFKYERVLGIPQEKLLSHIKRNLKIYKYGLKLNS